VGGRRVKRVREEAHEARTCAEMRRTTISGRRSRSRAGTAAAVASRAMATRRERVRVSAPG
jgi:hypothetical protein